MNQTPNSTLIFPHCAVHIDHDAQLVRTTFADGTHCDACPHDTDAYRQHATDKGANGDEWLYAIQHDLAHVIYAHVFGNGISPVLWDLAHGGSAQGPQFDAEEQAVQSFQRAYGTGRLNA